MRFGAVDDEKEELTTEEKVGVTIIALIGGYAVLRFGRQLFLRKGIGPVMRLVYKRVPKSRAVVRSSVGDLPILHEEELSLHVIAESLITIGFWVAFELDESFKRGVEQYFTLFLFRANQTLQGFNYFDPGVVDAIIAASGPAPVATVEDDDVASVITSSTGLIQVGMLDAWRIDP